MSDTLTHESAETAEAPAEEIVPTFDLTTADGVALAVADAGDARIEEGNLPRVAKILEHLRNRADSLRTAIVSVTNRYREVAEDSATLRTFLVLDTGHPDWAGSSTAFKRLVDGMVADAFGDTLTKEERNRAMAAIRQHVKRTYLEPAIRAYIAASKFPEKKGKPGVDWPEDDAFRFHVRAEYVAANLAIPTKYQTPEDKAAAASAAGSSGGPGAGQASALETLGTALAGLQQVTPRFAGIGILRAISAEAVRLTDPKSGNVPDRDKVRELYARINGVTHYIGKALDGKMSDADAEKMAALLFDPKADAV